MEHPSEPLPFPRERDLPLAVDLLLSRLVQADAATNLEHEGRILSAADASCHLERLLLEALTEQDKADALRPATEGDRIGPSKVARRVAGRVFGVSKTTVERRVSELRARDAERWQAPRSEGTSRFVTLCVTCDELPCTCEGG